MVVVHVVVIINGPDWRRTCMYVSGFAFRVILLTRKASQGRVNKLMVACDRYSPTCGAAKKKEA